MEFGTTLSLKSYGVEKAICKLGRAHREPFSRTFRINETQEQLERQLVSPKLPLMLPIGATGRRQARYSTYTRRVGSMRTMSKATWCRPLLYPCACVCTRKATWCRPLFLGGRCGECSLLCIFLNMPPTRVCAQCAATVSIRKSVCTCGHVLSSKKSGPCAARKSKWIAMSIKRYSESEIDPKNPLNFF